jgi:8-hydroxy-5-deazaflavin:NADPH oxidoreductase
MKVGFLGAGTVTGTFARHLIPAGHTVVVSNSRGPETLAKFIADLGPGSVAGPGSRLPSATSLFSLYIG